MNISQEHGYGLPQSRLSAALAAGRALTEFDEDDMPALAKNAAVHTPPRYENRA